METRSRVIAVALDGNSEKIKTQPIYQYDHGQMLNMTGWEDASKIQVHYASPCLKQAVNLMAREQDGMIVADIPDELTQFAQDIQAYVYMEDSESGLTVKHVTIPVTSRPRPTILTLEAPQMGPVNQLSVELQNLIGQVGEIQAESSELNEELKAGVEKTNALMENVQNMTVSAEGLPAGQAPTVEKQVASDGSTNLHFGLTAGKDGTDGQDGADGFSPKVVVSKLENEVTITITDANGTTTAVVMDGADGVDGTDGADGKDFVILGGAYATVDELSAGVTAPAVGDTYNVGAGAPYNLYRWTGSVWEDQGKIQGADGFSPTVAVSKADGVTTVVFTTAAGETTAAISDGEKGDEGVSVTHSWEGSVLTMTSASGTTQTDLKGETGAAGYTPVRGTDYWTADDIAQIKTYVDDAILNGAW